MPVCIEGSLPDGNGKCQGHAEIPNVSPVWGRSTPSKILVAQHLVGPKIKVEYKHIKPRSEYHYMDVVSTWALKRWRNSCESGHLVSG